MYENIILTPYTCYMPTYYLNNKCDFCEFKPYVKCEANGYHTKEIKSHFEEQQDLQKEIDKLEESAKQTKNKNKNTKKNKKKKAS